jgi:hypothetical protein
VLILKYAWSFINLSLVYLIPTLRNFSTLWRVHESCYNFHFPQSAPLCSTITKMHQYLEYFEVFHGFITYSLEVQNSVITKMHFLFHHPHFIPYLEYFSNFHHGLSLLIHLMTISPSIHFTILSYFLRLHFSLDTSILSQFNLYHGSEDHITSLKKYFFSSPPSIHFVILSHFLRFYHGATVGSDLLHYLFFTSISPSLRGESSFLLVTFPE